MSNECHVLSLTRYPLSVPVWLYFDAKCNSNAIYYHYVSIMCCPSLATTITTCCFFLFF
jgi:hypothetical protein